MISKRDFFSSSGSEWVAYLFGGLVSATLTVAILDELVKQKETSTMGPLHIDLPGEYVGEKRELSNNESLNDHMELEEKDLQLCFTESADEPIDWEHIDKEIFDSLSWDKLKVGEPIELEFIIENLLEEFLKEEVINHIYKLVLDNTNHPLLLCTVMHALSHMDYEVFYPYGAMMVMAMLSHNDKNVVSYALKAISNWNSKDSLKYVKNFGPQQSWAVKEWERIKKYIEENGDK